MSLPRVILFIIITVALLLGGMWYGEQLDMRLEKEHTKEKEQLVEEEAKFMETLSIKDTVVGNGPEAREGDTVSVHYTGTFLDGKKFDSSLDRNESFKFTIGRGDVIQGWDLGLQGKRVGGKREITVPPELGYGAMGSPPIIPPNATLKFTIELLGIERK